MKILGLQPLTTKTPDTICCQSTYSIPASGIISDGNSDNPSSFFLLKKSFTANDNEDIFSGLPSKHI
jgi:hypothetical protein